MIAVGVARPSASGQVMTTTVIANSSASTTGAPTSDVPDDEASTRPPISATSTSQKAARSARRCAGAFEFWASWTSLTICASAVSAPTARRPRPQGAGLVDRRADQRRRPAASAPAGSRR